MNAKSSVSENGPTVGLEQMRMQLNPVTLRFAGACAHLEDAFQQRYLIQSMRPMRIALVLAAFLYALFGVLDVVMIPSVKHLTWLIRFAFVCPAVLLFAGLTYSKRCQRYLQPLLALLLVFGGAGIIMMILVAPPPANHSYYAGLILIFMFGYTFAKAQFVWATLSGWILVLLYEVVAIGFIRAPMSILISNNFFFISSNIVGMLACYSIELASRRDFFLAQLLAAEQAKVREANRDLEARVRMRTIDLEQINRELAIEIRERRRAEEERIRLADQLKQAEKMEAIGNMAAGVAHDLNNILSGLVSYPDLLLMDIPEDSSLRKTVVTIKRSGQKAAAMVQDLLTLARRGVANKKVINPNELVEEYLASPEFESLGQQHPHIDFRVELDDHLLNVLASPLHLSKSLMNLVANAAEAQLVPGSVVIATENRSLDQPLIGYEPISPGDYVTVRVSDTGVGIDPEDLHQIFEPFFTKKRMGRSGTGLGMSVVWATLKDAGGYIDVESREGHGTTFTLYLPVTRQMATIAEGRVSIEDYLGTERVLVVDDLADQREIATAMLSKLGYSVTAVASGEAALDYLAHNRVDILVLDMIMDPGMDGCETYRRVVLQHPGQKAIIASGYSESDRVREAQRLGAGVYVKKPYTLEKIAMALRGELDRGSDSD